MRPQRIILAIGGLIFLAYLANASPRAAFESPPIVFNRPKKPVSSVKKTSPKGNLVTLQRTSRQNATENAQGRSAETEASSSSPVTGTPLNVTTTPAIYEHVYTEESIKERKRKTGIKGILRQSHNLITALLGTGTGALAAVGGGFLLYAGLVHVFGDDLYHVLSNQGWVLPKPGTPIIAPLPHNHLHAIPPPHHLQHRFGDIQRNHGRNGGMQQQQGSAMHSNLERLLRTVQSIDYPELLFRHLKIYDEECKQRTVCELEQFLTSKGAAGLVMNFIGPKIPGMHKYQKAMTRGLRQENCAVIYKQCPDSLGQRILKLVGLR